MQLVIKLPVQIATCARVDLGRPHPFAFERVGFLIAKPAWISPSSLNLIVTGYHGVADDDYLPDDRVGASIGPDAMRKALQETYKAKASLLHLHAHAGRGRPRFSDVDVDSSESFVPGFFNVMPDTPHGIVVFSDDSASGLVWTERDGPPKTVTRFVQPSGPYRSYGGQNV